MQMRLYTSLEAATCQRRFKEDIYVQMKRICARKICAERICAKKKEKIEANVGWVCNAALARPDAP